MAYCTNQHQSSIGDWTGLQHHFRYAIMFNIISTWENLANHVQHHFNLGKAGDWTVDWAVMTAGAVGHIIVIDFEKC